jgi:hypothetical protein
LLLVQGDVLALALSMIPITNVSEIIFIRFDFFFIFAKNNNAKNYKKMAIMVTDCTLNLGAHFSTMSNEFNRHNITLYVVAIGTPAYEIWNRYHILPDHTGMHRFLLIFS